MQNSQIFYPQMEILARAFFSVSMKKERILEKYFFSHDNSAN